MIKPDVIVCHPDNCDYPLWRKLVHQDRTRFNQVEIVFTKTYSGTNFTEFVKRAMFEDWIMPIMAENVNAGEDWRDKAIHQALMHSLHSEWILFTEQDFFPQDGFWDHVYSLCDSNDVIAAYDANRMHPCFILIKRAVLYKTSMNFGIVPDKLDHFGLIQRDLEQLAEKGEIKIAKIEPSLYVHMNGLSSNFYLISLNQDPNYKPEEFQQYLKDCLSAPVLLDQLFVDIASRYLQRVGK